MYAAFVELTQGFEKVLNHCAYQLRRSGNEIVAFMIVEKLDEDLRLVGF